MDIDDAIRRLRATIAALAEPERTRAEIDALAMEANGALDVLEGLRTASGAPAPTKRAPFTAPIAGDFGGDDDDSTHESDEASSRHRPKRLAHLCILVVEDELDSRELIELLLLSEGASVHTAASATEALDLLERVAPDVVLSDIGMPGRDGYWLASQLRVRMPTVPAVALTAFSTSDDVARAKASGFHHHLAKPVDAELLVRTLTVCSPTAA